MLLKIELSRMLSEIKAYLLDNAVSIVDNILICIGLLVGVGSDFFPGRSQGYALIGMMLWRCTIICLQTSCGIIQKELRLGTLEQLMSSSYSFLKLLIVRLEAKMLIEIWKLFLAMLVIAAIFNIKFYNEVDFILIITAFLVSIAGAFGMGFIVAGIALVYKKASALVNSISYFVLFFTGVFIPLELLPDSFSLIAKSLPFIWAINTIQSNQFNYCFVSLVMTSIFWLVLGCIIFKFCNSKILISGTAGKY